MESFKDKKVTWTAPDGRVYTINTEGCETLEDIRWKISELKKLYGIKNHDAKIILLPQKEM